MDETSLSEPENPGGEGESTKHLTIKTSSLGGKKSPLISHSDLLSPCTKSSIGSSPYNSPPSSAFVSALQSPYISPRALNPPPPPPPPPLTLTLSLAPPQAQTLVPSPPVSYCGSQSDDIPSCSYTPPPERFDFSDDPCDQKLKFVTCVQVSDPAPPRISFSFPVPRISFAKGSFSPSSNAELSCRGGEEDDGGLREKKCCVFGGAC